MEYRIDIYKLDVVNQEFTKIDEITTFLNLSYRKDLNELGICTFNLNVYDDRASQANLRRYVNQIAVWRGSELVFFGPIAHVTAEYSNIKGYVTVEAYSYLYHLISRYTLGDNDDGLVQYNQIEQCSIAWDLINDTQNQNNGTLLITQGDLPNSVKRDRTYEYSSVGQALVNLSNVINGFDYTFDPQYSGDDITSVEFNCYYPYKGNDLSDKNTLKIGDNVHRVNAVTSTQLYNYAKSIGAGTDNPITSELEYGTLAKGYTRREVIIDEKDVTLPSTLSLKTQSYLNKESVERFNLDIHLKGDRKPDLDDFDLGDFIYYDLNIENSGGYVDYIGKARITGYQVDLDLEGVETVVPRLDIIR